MNEQPIGQVKVVRRYPVKSMKGEDLDQVLVRFTGLAGDRIYAFVDPLKQTNFPWLSAREVSEMILFEPRLKKFPSPEKKYPSQDEFGVEVTTPEGEVFDIVNQSFVKKLEERWKRPMILRFSEAGQQDSRPISIFGLSTLRHLSAEIGLSVDHRRFRANFYVEWNDQKPFFEEDLLNREIRIGEKLRLYITKKDKRCVIINLEPDTANSTPQVLKYVGKERQGYAGVYASVLEEGIVKPGDEIRLV